MLQLLKSMFQTRQITCISIAFLAILFAFGLTSDAQAYTWSIDSFDSVIEIHEDASITVTETIDVTFDIQKHGIYREIPVRYTDTYGNSFKTDFDVLNIQQDGQPAQVNYSYGYSDVSLRIGDPDRYISGTHTYEITYTVDRVFLYFDEYDELYWNVTGTDWEVPIDRSSATVILPDGAQVEQFSCYTGYYGSTAQNCTKNDAGDVAQFEANDFLTVAVAFTKGQIYEPTLWDRFVWLVFDNWYALIPLLVLGFTFWMWYTRGKDPKMNKTVIAEYEPPNGIKSVYAGMLVHGRLKRDHLTSMIIQMAVDGYLKIKAETKKKNRKDRRKPLVTLIPLKGSQGLDKAHAQFHKMIFKGKMAEIPLKKLKNTIPAQKMNRMKSELRKKIVSDGYYVKRSFVYQVLFIFLGVAVFAFSVVLGAVLGLFTSFVGTTSGIAIIVFGYLMPALTKEGVEMRRKVLGFKDFMHTAERYRSAWHEKEHIFADYLPYAIAFDDVDQWAKTFKDVHQAAPDWYAGDTAFMALAMTGGFDSIASSIQSAAATPMPSSSGSGGGGFSGGGFGGGGGGSW